METYDVLHGSSVLICFNCMKQTEVASLPSFPQKRQQAASLLPCAVTWLPHGHLQSRWEFSNDTDLVKQHCQTSRYGHDMMNFLSKPLPCPVQSHHSLPVHAPVAICPSKVDSSDLSHCCFTTCIWWCKLTGGHLLEIAHPPEMDLIRAIPYWRNQLWFTHDQLDFNCSSARYFSSNSALKTSGWEIEVL